MGNKFFDIEDHEQAYTWKNHVDCIKIETYWCDKDEQCEGRCDPEYISINLPLDFIEKIVHD